MALSEAQSTGKMEPESIHVSDPAILPFIQPAFDPAQYLNATLPPLSVSSVTSSIPKQPTAVPLSDLSARTQILLSQLNAQTSRLSNTLTQLTDDILRTGGRLAYEVELLRGETTGLSELLEDRLKAEIQRFAPADLTTQAPTTRNGEPLRTGDAGAAPNTPTTAAAAAAEPDHMTRLRTLTHVRSRLESVIRTFNEAMQWPLPASELSASLTSSLISVSGPSSSDPVAASAAREEAGRAFAERMRAEIAELVGREGEEGVEEAMARVRRLKELAGVWRGTVEERARARFVDGLARMVEERGGGGVSGRQEGQGNGNGLKAEERGRGFLEGLQRIRGNIYLE